MSHVFLRFCITSTLAISFIIVELDAERYVNIHSVKRDNLWFRFIHNTKVSILIYITYIQMILSLIQHTICVQVVRESIISVYSKKAPHKVRHKTFGVQFINQKAQKSYSIFTAVPVAVTISILPLLPTVS